MCLYIARGTRPDIQFVINQLASYSKEPYEKHFAILKRTIRYLKFTANKKLHYTKDICNLKIYTDSNFNRIQDQKRSTAGTMFFHCNNLITWYSKKHSLPRSSTTGAETDAMLDGAEEAIYFYKLIRELFNVTSIKPIDLYCDNEAAVKTTCHGKPHDRVRAYAEESNRISSYVEHNFIRIHHLAGTEMLADGLTKPLTENRLNYLFEACNLKIDF